MPYKLDFDRYLRDYHTLTPGQRDAVVRLVVREAKQARAAAIHRLLRSLGGQSWKAVVRGLGTLRRVSAAARGLTAVGWRRYDRRRRLRATAAQLYAMDDRALKDIGLRRGEIDFALSGQNDPTRRPRSSREVCDRIGVASQSAPNRQPDQRAGLPLVLRNACAG